MTSEQGRFHKETGAVQITAAAALVSGEAIRLPDGRAGFIKGQKSAASGDEVAVATFGRFKVTKSTSVVFLPGQEVWWDDANAEATYALNGDFFIGVCCEDDTVAAATTRVLVDLNRRANYDIELGKTGFEHTETLGLGVDWQGGEEQFEFDAVAEAATAASLSVDSIAVTTKFIAEFEANIADNGDDAALDINIGLANASHATDADSITESLFIHIDGNALDILAESDDGTTEVAATDTTVNYAEGTRFFVQIDARDLTDIQVYINGALVLSGTTFRLDNATGPLKLLTHVEKSSNDTTAKVRVGKMRAYKTEAA